MPFDIPRLYRICIATCLYTFKDDLAKNWAKPLLKNEKRPLPVGVRRSKTSLHNTGDFPRCFSFKVFGFADIYTHRSQRELLTHISKCEHSFGYLVLHSGFKIFGHGKGVLKDSRVCVQTAPRVGTDLFEIRHECGRTWLGNTATFSPPIRSELKAGALRPARLSRICLLTL